MTWWERLQALLPAVAAAHDREAGLRLSIAQLTESNRALREQNDRTHELLQQALAGKDEAYQFAVNIQYRSMGFVPFPDAPHAPLLREVDMSANPEGFDSPAVVSARALANQANAEFLERRKKRHQ